PRPDDRQRDLAPNAAKPQAPGARQGDPYEGTPLVRGGSVPSPPARRHEPPPLHGGFSPGDPGRREGGVVADPSFALYSQRDGSPPSPLGGEGLDWPPPHPQPLSPEGRGEFLDDTEVVMRTFLLPVVAVGLLGLVPTRGNAQEPARAILDQA